MVGSDPIVEAFPGSDGAFKNCTAGTSQLSGSQFVVEDQNRIKPLRFAETK
jgi:hypothetical protein